MGETQVRKCDQLNSKKASARRRKGAWTRKMNEEEKNTGLRKVKKLLAHANDPRTSRFDRPRYIREAEMLAKDLGYYLT